MQTSLAAILRERQRHNPAYSLRAFARDLGVSHTYLSLVLGGKRSVPPKRVADFARRLQLAQRDARAWMESAIEETLATPARRRQGRSRFAALEVDRFRAVSDWYHVALLDLTLLDDFRPDSKWIARRLGIAVGRVRQAMARLERLGLLEYKDGALRKTQHQLEVPTQRSVQAVRAFHVEMIEKATRELRKSGKVAFSARDITATTIPIDPAKLGEAKRRIQRFRRALLRYLSEGKKTELYQLNVQLFPLTRSGRLR